MPKDIIPEKPEYSQEDLSEPSYIFALDFLLLRAECVANIGESATASRIIEYLLSRGRCVRDRVRAANTNVVIQESTGNFLGAVKVFTMLYLTEV